MEMPVAPRAFAGTLKRMAIPRKPWPMTAISSGNRSKAMSGTPMGIDVREKGKAEGASRGAPPPNVNYRTSSGGAGSGGGTGGSDFARRPRNGTRLNSASFSLSFP